MKPAGLNVYVTESILLPVTNNYFPMCSKIQVDILSHSMKIQECQLNYPLRIQEYDGVVVLIRMTMMEACNDDLMNYEVDLHVWEDTFRKGLKTIHDDYASYRMVKKVLMALECIGKSSSMLDSSSEEELSIRTRRWC